MTERAGGVGMAATKVVEYKYDLNERLVGKTLDPDGAGEEEATEEYYAYDQTPFSTRENASQMLFRFEGSEVSDLKSRYLWAPVVDLLLSDEKLTGPSTPGDIYWALGDNLNTVRDIAQYNPGNDTTTIVNHRVYDAFGKLTSETNGAVDLIFAFTGRYFDESTGEQYNWRRWYDGRTGRWLSEDPIAFDADDSNLYRYCTNNPVMKVDPSGKWGESVHYDNTREWAIAVGVMPTAAEAIAAADKATDGLIGGRAPIPIYGDQDYHFNRNRVGMDSRDFIAAQYLASATMLATETPRPGNVVKVLAIAQRVGIALHAKQDWVAHGDYGYRVPKSDDIWIVHNSRSPQKTFGNPGNYPDDPTLDVVGSPDGRATRPYLWATWGWSWFSIQDTEYAWYEKGTKRIKLTQDITKNMLRSFAQALQTRRAAADVRIFFFGH